MDVVKVLIDATRAAVGIPAAAFALSSIGLNLQFGYTGLLNFGHVASMLVGAYGMAITVEMGGSLWLGIPIGVLCAVMLGLLVGAPTLRLRADYLAIVTIAAAEMLRLVVRSSLAAPLTKGIFGIQAFADEFFALNPIPNGYYGIGRLRFDARGVWMMLVGWAVVLLAIAFIHRLTASPWGRVIRAIREDEDAARSLGKNVFGYKLQSLMIGGAIGALAGMVLAIDQQNVTPDNYIPLLTFYAFTIVILGGPGTLWGPVIGSVVFWFLFELLDGIMTAAVVEGWFGSLLGASDIGPLRFALFGIGLMWLMAFRPQGIFGTREEMLIDGR
ncbi:MAG: branched-chain amino acid ABC transporter permease [Actinobacteria bacterium]|nr:branched-chain amino acid ABC transporter permease [Actinomycetota bacterium]MBU1493105.1 branched-chain amino acid ABC transporter permease [Actinomycetota bacterium]